jgi:hypothetical protein
MDKERANKILKDNGMTKVAFAELMGLKSGTVHTAFGARKLSKPMIKRLEQLERYHAQKNPSTTEGLIRQEMDLPTEQVLEAKIIGFPTNKFLRIIRFEDGTEGKFKCKPDKYRKMGQGVSVRLWIVPKMLSQCVQATEGLSLDSEEQAWMLEQSVTWRSKSMSKPYWLRRWKKGDYVQHLCGLMLKPSHHQSFEEKYVESLEDIPVSRSAQPEGGKEKKTQGTCGHTSEGMSGQLDLFGVSLRMSSVTPRWGYGESCPIWKQKVTDAYGEYSQRKKLAHPTKEKESLSWPSPRAGNPGSRKPGTGGKVLSEEAKRWGTPQASDHGVWEGI